ncbi:hypothetical protein GCM10010347_11000 [Streptomyces cirratus]|uniref:PknH-like extracellular domain-containing protein n=1 Tax=Streptomyces cirratus TaxID=68187 RepID=A0ABQ3EK51_9ACTN|nr:hypothetical protein [Streptomyces cirratus]GHB43592.1 hypothetical protein GCM10010347_11000 [Streptomyces cirratus]
MRQISLAARLFTVAALPLALTACSTIAPKAAGLAASAAAPVPDPNKGLLTGSQLKTALAPASFFATGFTADPESSRDTGDGYRPPAATEVPTPDCTKLDKTAWTEITGITGVSFAQDAYVNKNSSEEFAQEIDVYRGTTATTVLDALGKISKGCPKYTDGDTNAKVAVTEKPLAGVGDGAWAITLTSSAWQGGTTLVAARVGTAVVTVLASSSTDTGMPGATKLTKQLVTSLAGKA